MSGHLNPLPDDGAWLKISIVTPSFSKIAPAIKTLHNDRSLYQIQVQYRFVTDKKGNLLVNFIGRFENFKDDFDYARQKISLPLIELPQLMKGDHKDYRFYYSAHSKNIVGERYAKDIRLVGYDF